MSNSIKHNNREQDPTNTYALLSIIMLSATIIVMVGKAPLDLQSSPETLLILRVGVAGFFFFAHVYLAYKYFKSSKKSSANKF